jgi:hypothetical protein
MALQDAHRLLQPQPQASQQQPQLPRRHATSLRRLELYVRVGGINAADLETASRFLDWLAHKPSPAPMLAALKLTMLLGGGAERLADRAFRQFAHHAGLELLQLHHVGYPWGPVVSEEAILRVASEQPPRQRPFEHLRDLEITIDAASAVAPLAKLLPCGILTHLQLTLSYSDRGDPTTPVLQPLATSLLQLRVLRVHSIGDIRYRGADLRMLAALIHLRELELTDGHIVDLCDGDVGAMLSPMRHLRTLVLSFPLEGTSSALLQIVGGACPVLRKLKVLSSPEVLVGPMFDRDDLGIFGEGYERPLFPCLEYLSVGLIETGYNIDMKSVRVSSCLART